MVIDSSAVVAILRLEADARRFVLAIQQATERFISAGTYIESSIVLATRAGRGILADLDSLIDDAQIEVVPVSRLHVSLARQAYLRFGKGHHPARLNLGDCIAYALAKELDVPLLFKGDDFAQTDLRPALRA